MYSTSGVERTHRILHGWAWLSLADFNAQATVAARDHSWWSNLPQFPCHLSCRVSPVTQGATCPCPLTHLWSYDCFLQPSPNDAPPYCGSFTSLSPLVGLKCSITHILPYSEVSDGLMAPSITVRKAGLQGLLQCDDAFPTHGYCYLGDGHSHEETELDTTCNSSWDHRGTALVMENQPSGVLTPRALPTVDTYPWPFLLLFSHCVTIDTTIMNLFLKLQNGVKFPKLVSFYCSLFFWLLIMGGPNPHYAFTGSDERPRLQVMGFLPQVLPVQLSLSNMAHFTKDECQTGGQIITGTCWLQGREPNP